MEMKSTKTASFVYRLLFGDFIAYAGKQQPARLLLEQGIRKEFSDGSKNYYLQLLGIKVNRKIYQPTEIEAELDIMQTITGSSSQETNVAPKFNDVKTLLLQRQVKLDILEVDRVNSKTLEYKELHNIAMNCYVYEITPQLKVQLKLDEIEEDYQRYLAEDNDRYDESDAGDGDMELSHDAEIEALFK